MRIAFLTYGTLGDVLPVSSLAVATRSLLEEKKETVECYLVTKRGQWNDDVEKILKSENITVIDIEKEVYQNEHQSSWDKGHLDFMDEELFQRHREMMLAFQACKCLQINAIVFSLFACEGWFISQAINIPCIAVSPFLQARMPPVKFEKNFKKHFPTLHQLLKNSLDGCVSYDDIEAWMWRLYLHDFEAFAREIGTSPCPFVNAEDGVALPKATPLLYGISPTLVQRPPSWPTSIHLCGSWSIEMLPKGNIVLTEYAESNYKGWSKIKEFVSRWAGKIIFVGFGSMEKLGVADAKMLHLILEVVFEGARKYGLSLICSLEDEFIDEHSKAMSCISTDEYLMISSSTFVPHGIIFPHCKIVVHHGGSGTVHSALRAGVPQIVCPMMFDQSYWADRIDWLGLGVNAGTPRKLTIDKFSQAIEKCCSLEILKLVQSYSNTVCKENGLTIAAEILVEKLGFDL